MADSWDDDDFEVSTVFTAPTVATAAASSSKVVDSWEDEVDETEIELNNKKKIVVVEQSAAQIEAAKKKAKEAEAALEAKLKLAILDNETPEERKARIRMEVEKGENVLAQELFDVKDAKGASSSIGGTLGSVTKGLGSMPLKTKQDHSTLGTAIVTKLTDSTTFNIGAFYKSLSKCLESPSVTAETLDDILKDITRIQESKIKAVKPTVMKKSKKDLAKEAKKHSDVFGGSDNYGDKYDGYNDMEDDFM